MRLLHALAGFSFALASIVAITIVVIGGPCEMSFGIAQSEIALVLGFPVPLTLALIGAAIAWTYGRKALVAEAALTGLALIALLFYGVIAHTPSPSYYDPHDRCQIQGP